MNEELKGRVEIPHNTQDVPLTTTKRGLFQRATAIAAAGIQLLTDQRTAYSQSIPHEEVKKIPPNTELSPEHRQRILSLYPVTEVFKDKFLKANIRYGGPGILNGSHDARTDEIKIGSTHIIMALAEVGHMLFDPRTSLDLYGTTDPQKTDPKFLHFVKDLFDFADQPPDQYEPLRQYLREREGPKNPDGTPKINMPQVGWVDTRMHWGIMHLISHSGGNLDLLPPVLRTHFKDYIKADNFKVWDSALSWYQGLSGRERLMVDFYWPTLERWTQRQNLESKVLPPPDFEAKIPEQQKTNLELVLKRLYIDYAAQFDKDIRKPPTRDDDDTGYLILALKLYTIFPEFLVDHPLVNLLKGISRLDKNSSTYQEDIVRIAQTPGATNLAMGLSWGFFKEGKDKLPFGISLVPIEVQLDLIEKLLLPRDLEGAKSILLKYPKLKATPKPTPTPTVTPAPTPTPISTALPSVEENTETEDSLISEEHID